MQTRFRLRRVELYHFVLHILKVFVIPKHIKRYFKSNTHTKIFFFMYFKI
jgi:hypothetical protein